jgi:hypothetical protein
VRRIDSSHSCGGRSRPVRAGALARLVAAFSIGCWALAGCEGEEVDADASDTADRFDEAPDASGCAVTPGSLDECFVGDFFAECGPSGAPGLACSPSGRAGGRGCFWFSGPCVPPGFSLSACSEQNLCCAQGWPYADQAYYADLHPYLYAYGNGAWSAAREINIAVVVDPSIGPPANASLTCGGGRRSGA